MLWRARRHVKCIHEGFTKKYSMACAHVPAFEPVDSNDVVAAVVTMDSYESKYFTKFIICRSITVYKPTSRRDLG